MHNTFKDLRVSMSSNQLKILKSNGKCFFLKYEQNKSSRTLEKPSFERHESCFSFQSITDIYQITQKTQIIIQMPQHFLQQRRGLQEYIYDIEMNCRMETRKMGNRPRSVWKEGVTWRGMGRIT